MPLCSTVKDCLLLLCGRKQRGENERRMAANSCECSICLEGLFEAEHGYPGALPCGHIFHEFCLQAALITSERCPLCNATGNIAQITRLYVNTGEVRGATASAALLTLLSSFVFGTAALFFFLVGDNGRAGAAAQFAAALRGKEGEDTIARAKSGGSRKRNRLSSPESAAP